METLKNILTFELFYYKEHSLTVIELVLVLSIFVITRIVLWLMRKALLQKTKLHKLDKGSAIALFQLIKYVIWIIAIALILETIGVKVTLLIAGSAALLVGVGLGLQQTFNDIISGIILLFEHSVKVDDILEIDNDIVMIKEIGLRTSKGLNRRQIVVILPNSHITTNKVINWSHQEEKTLFSINIGVSYDSDIDLVIQILENSVVKHPEVLESDLLEARLIGFGNSSVDFEVLFYSKNIFYIERIKSDIRRILFKELRQQQIVIPFPQIDIHLTSS